MPSAKMGFVDVAAYRAPKFGGAPTQGFRHWAGIGRPFRTTIQHLPSFHSGADLVCHWSLRMFDPRCPVPVQDLFMMLLRGLRHWDQSSRTRPCDVPSRRVAKPDVALAKSGG